MNVSVLCLCLYVCSKFKNRVLTCGVTEKSASTSSFKGLLLLILQGVASLFLFLSLSLSVSLSLSYVSSSLSSSISLCPPPPLYCWPWGWSQRFDPIASHSCFLWNSYCTVVKERIYLVHSLVGKTISQFGVGAERENPSKRRTSQHFLFSTI